MAATRKTEPRPAVRPPVAYSPAEPEAFAEHVTHAGCGRVVLSMHCDVRDGDEPRGNAFIRVDTRGSRGHETISIGVADLDDFVRALAEAIRLARHHRALPEEGSLEMERERLAQTDALMTRHKGNPKEVQ